MRRESAPIPTQYLSRHYQVSSLTSIAQQCVVFTAHSGEGVTVKQRQYPIKINSQYFSKRTHTCQLMQYRYASEKRIFSQVMAPDNRHREILAAIEVLY
ncbi:hypothetical protein DdX_17202 [Ditylenchus destructor]|uniref:Uncharacterized protein n=1 Tax=Ditylenchus destructor TaxID=166010 RepID=A0AAD4MPG4_9BILA|nr:hypothetical protein DdX_17202 [Ditylenchus destructor]